MLRMRLAVGCLALLVCSVGTTQEPQPANPVDELTLTISGAEDVELRLRRIPAGSFMMGSPADETHRQDDEGPIRRVTISEPFYMGVYPVTQAQWQAVMGSNPSRFAGDPERPVEQVSWDDCQRFVEALNEMGIGTFRLPTEAEWEYACRAGTETRYYWGDDEDKEEVGEYAWYLENAGRQTHPVGRKKPNPWGLHDMSGNVYEWCQDWYAESYPDVDETDPTGPGAGLYRVMRGGSWHHWPRFLRSGNRFRYTPGVRYFHVGMRLVMTHP